jgi:hypothetical protein
VPGNDILSRKFRAVNGRSVVWIYVAWRWSVPTIFSRPAKDDFGFRVLDLYSVLVNAAMV